MKHLTYLLLLGLALCSICCYGEQAQRQPVHKDVSQQDMPKRGTLQKPLAGHRIAKTLYDPRESTTETKLPLSSPFALYEDQSRDYWVGDVMGLYRYEEAQEHWSWYRSVGGALEWVRVIWQDRKGRMWILAGLEPRVRYFDGTSWREPENVTDGEDSAEVRVMFNGLKGELWVLSKRGLLSYDGDHWLRPIRIPESTAQAYVRMKRRSPDDEMSTAVALLEKLTSPSAPLSISTMGAITSEVSCGLQDREGYIWLGAEKGILRLDRQDRSFKIYPLPGKLTAAECAYEDREGRLWFADTHGHVSCYDKQASKWLSYDLATALPRDEFRNVDSSLFIYAMFQDRERRMLFCTDKGLIVFTEHENSWSVHNSETGDLETNSVTAIIEDRRNRLWLGTGRGLLVLEP